MEAACSAPKEESPSPHRQRVLARNETPGPGSVQKPIPEVEKDDMELALRWLRGDLSVLTCFPFFVKRGKKCFSYEILRLSETSKFEEKAEMELPDDSSRKETEL